MEYSNYFFGFWLSAHSNSHLIAAALEVNLFSNWKSSILLSSSVSMTKLRNGFLDGIQFTPFKIIITYITYVDKHYFKCYNGYNGYNDR